MLSLSLSSSTTTTTASLKPSETIITLSLLPSTSRNPNSSSISIHSLCTKKPPPPPGSSSRSNASNSSWNSNAETFRSSRFKFQDQYNDDEDDEDDDYDSGSRFQWRDSQKRKWWSDADDDDDDNVVEQVIDNVWFFKVLRSFGWLLPVIIMSMLATTGPKAFLMALALPLGQSAVSFAIDKLFGRTRDSSKPRPRTRKKPFTRPASVEINDEELDESSGTSEKKQDYQSWVATDNGSVRQKVDADKRKPSFGGWDELDRQQRPDKRTTRARRAPTGGPRGQGLEKGKMSRRGRRGDTPLLLRLLISVFPFLGSWTRLL